MSNQLRTIVLGRLPRPDDSLWRASLGGAYHCGGVGRTPEEAIGWLVLNHPQRCGVGEFAWESAPPRLPHPGVEQYPTGEQEAFDQIEEHP